MDEIKIPENYKYISSFLTFRCNLNCGFCLNAFDKTFHRKGEEISGEKLLSGLNRISSNNKLPITFSGGEPFLHNDFFYILNNLKPELKIDLLTNLQWGEKGIKKFIKEVDPAKLKRDSLYPSIRVSYHPEQMGDGESLVRDVKRLKEAGYSIGIYSVQYPSPAQLESITQMQFRCLNSGIEFRIKDFTGIYSGLDDKNKPFEITYGNYSKYLNSTFQEEKKECICKTSELLIGPNGDVYRCHRDVFARENPIGNITNPSFVLEDKFRECNNYGSCHPCDVKLKTDNKQSIGNTSVEIRNIK
jgi:MoaA/NifB/PqqE/SkfB family radical SAM enzyme